MKHINRKKLLLFSSLVALIYTKPERTYPNKLTYQENYEMDNLFASYQENNIFIYNPNDPNKNTCQNSILILDERDGIDPNMRIVNSYQITDLEMMYNIIYAIEEFQKRYPSNWNRSTNSMKNEWIIHNILYFLNYETERTESVDFNNKDEKLYNQLLIRYLLP